MLKREITEKKLGEQIKEWWWAGKVEYELQRRFLFTKMQTDNETHRIADETISTNMKKNTYGYANMNYMFGHVHVCSLQVHQRVHESMCVYSHISFSMIRGKNFCSKWRAVNNQFYTTKTCSNHVAWVHIFSCEISL